MTQQSNVPHSNSKLEVTEHSLLCRCLVIAVRAGSSTVISVTLKNCNLTVSLKTIWLRDIGDMAVFANALFCMYNLILSTFLSTYTFHFVIHVCKVLSKPSTFTLMNLPTVRSSFMLGVARYGFVAGNHLSTYTLQHPRRAKTIHCNIAETWNVACYVHVLIHIILCSLFFYMLTIHLYIGTTTGTSLMFSDITVPIFLFSHKIICIF
jgi:hypothetical protein